MVREAIEGGDAAPFVSTGHLPRVELVRTLVSDAYERYRRNLEGACSNVYPALARVDPDLFGLSVASTTGEVHGMGDAEVEFAIMSVAKPFVFALVCEALGPEGMGMRLGGNPTGPAFNSVAAIEESVDGRTNPMVNPGAIATTSLAPGESADERW